MSLPVKLFGTTGTEELVQGIYARLEDKLSIVLGHPKVEIFDNENLEVQVDNVRGHFVVVLHSHVLPANTRLIELFAFLDAIKNAQAADVLAVLPYMDYSRSDRKDKPRISTLGKWVAKNINLVCGVKKVLLLDPHSEYIKEYFDPTADEISARYLWIDYLEKEFFLENPKEDCVIIFSDVGSAKRYRNVPEILNLPHGYIDKGKRDDDGKPKVEGIIGDVKKKICIVVDDEILGGGTAISDAEALMKAGATSVSVLLVHPIFSKKETPENMVVERLENSLIEKIIITDSVPLGNKLVGSKKIKVIPVTGLLAEAIERTISDKSLTELYDPAQVALYKT